MGDVSCARCLVSPALQRCTVLTPCHSSEIKPCSNPHVLLHGKARGDCGVSRGFKNNPKGMGKLLKPNSPRSTVASKNV